MHRKPQLAKTHAGGPLYSCVEKTSAGKGAHSNNGKQIKQSTGQLVGARPGGGGAGGFQPLVGFSKASLLIPEQVWINKQASPTSSLTADATTEALLVIHTRQTDLKLMLAGNIPHRSCKKVSVKQLTMTCCTQR